MHLVHMTLPFMPAFLSHTLIFSPSLATNVRQCIFPWVVVAQSNKKNNSLCIHMSSSHSIRASVLLESVAECDRGKQDTNYTSLSTKDKSRGVGVYVLESLPKERRCKQDLYRITTGTLFSCVLE